MRIENLLVNESPFIGQVLVLGSGPVGLALVRDAQQRGRRSGARCGVADRVLVAAQVIRNDADNRPGTVRISLDGGHRIVVPQELDGPAGEQSLTRIRTAVVIGIMERNAQEGAAARCTADVNRNLRFEKLQRVVPLNAAAVGHGRSDGKAGINGGAESQRGRAVDRQRTILVEIVGRYDVANDAHT